MMGADRKGDLDSAQLAAIAGVTVRAAKAGLRKCFSGETWRGHRLVVSAVHGRGGNAGLTYRVRLNSLPQELQNRAIGLWPELAAPAEPAPVHAMVTTTGRDLVPATTRDIVRPRRHRSDKRKRRVFISRAWDQAVPFDDATKTRIAESTAKDLRSIWAKDIRGWRQVRQLALPELMKVTRAAGFAGNDKTLNAICMLPRGFIDRERGKGLAIAMYDKDAKAFFDHQPRIRRDWSYLQPGDVIIGDVHPMDILYRRDDGTTATPKLIAWMDGRSRFLIGHPVFLEEGQGIRMEHVAESFAFMVRDTGAMPAHLYLDNGGEYNWARFAEDAMRLVSSPTMPLKGVNDRDTRALIRAIAFNAPAKPIEPRFCVFEDRCRDLTGSIGGNRMVKKTHNVGRAPKPFPGTRAELWDTIQERIRYLNNTPMDVLGGRTPAQVFADRKRHEVDIVDLQTAFAKPKEVTLRRGEFRIDNVYYRHDALDGRPDLKRVFAYVPIFGDKSLIAVEGPDGTFLCHAEPSRYFRALDLDGAKESGRRKGLSRKGIGALRETVVDLDISTRISAFNALHPDAPEAEPADVIELNGEKKLTADDRRRLTEGGPAPAPEPETEDWYDLWDRREGKVS